MATKNRKTIVVTITEDMHEALSFLAPRHGATMAGLTRAVLARWLEEQGEDIDWIIEWGGKRAAAEDDAEPDSE